MGSDRTARETERRTIREPIVRRVGVKVRWKRVEKVLVKRMDDGASIFIGQGRTPTAWDEGKSTHGRNASMTCLAHCFSHEEIHEAHVL